MGTQKQVRDMVTARVYDNLTMLMLYLEKNDDHDFTEEVIQVFSKPDYVNPASEADIEVEHDKFGNFWIITKVEDPDGPYDSASEAWQAACENYDIEPYLDEAYEWYAVSDWLGYQLTRRGEMVEQIFGMNVWGRCATGQAIYLDYVMEDIYNELESNKGDNNV